MNKEENKKMMEEMMLVAASIMASMESAKTDPKIGVGALVICAVMMVGSQDLVKEMIDACADDLTGMLGESWKNGYKAPSKEELN